MKNVLVRTRLLPLLAAVTVVIAAFAGCASTPVSERAAQGKAYFEQREFDKAIKQFTLVIKAEPDNAEAWLMRGRAYANFGGIDQALLNINKAIGIDAGYTEAYYRRAGIYIAKKNYEAAFADFDTAIGLDPNDAEIYYRRGNEYYNRHGEGDLDRAMADSDKVIELNPQHILAHIIRGVVYLDKGDYDNAKAVFSEVIRIDPTYALGYYNRSVVYLNTGEYDKAIADNTKAIEFDSNDAYAYVNRAVLYGITKEYDKAIADCTKAIGLDPAFALAYNNRAYAYSFKDENLDKALADVNKAFELEPDSKDLSLFYDTRGYIYYRMKSYVEALDNLNAAVALADDNGEIYYHRALAYQARGETAAARADCEKALELQPDHAEAAALLADIERR
jgi:tetratricopeptide (TPR) repeat protein